MGERQIDKQTDRDRDRYPVRLRLSETETVRDRGRQRQSPRNKKHGFINKWYIIFFTFIRSWGTTLRSAVMKRNVDVCFSFTLLEELITSGVRIHPDKTTN